MKKTFHLDLDHTGVRLRHGPGADAPIVGEVPLDDPHFETRLEDLRRDAQALSDGPLTTQLTIPHSEVLFTSVDVPEDVKDDAARRKLIEAEMDGQTPYALDDLVIDWTQKSKTQIAVALVARETLDQAEDFAVTHGFNPQGFSSEPRKGLFRKRPTFGQTAFAASGGDASGRLPEPSVTRIADVLNDDTPVSATARGPVDAVPDIGDPASGSGAQGKEKTASDSTMAGRGDASGMGEVTAAAVAAVDAKAKDSSNKSASDTASGANDGQDGKSVQPATDRAAPVSAKDAVSKDDEAGSSGEPAHDSRATSAASSKGAVDSSASPSFSTQRTSGGEVAPGDGATPLGSIASRIAMLPDGGAGPQSDTQKTIPAMKVTNGGGAARKPQPKGRTAPTPTVRKVAPPEPGLAPRPANTPHAATALSPGIAADTEPRNEAEQMTVFGARRKVQSRRGLGMLPVLIGLLVAFAIAVGIWAAFFLLTPTQDALLAPSRTNGDVALVDPALPSDTGTSIVPSLQSEATDAPSIVVAPDVVTPDLTPTPGDDLALLQSENEGADDGSANRDPEGETPTEAGPTVDTGTDLDLQPGPEDPLRRPEGASDADRYAATGIEITPPQIANAPATDRLDGLRAPQADGNLREQDSVAALASAADPPNVPEALLPPPPPGERFELNVDGLVVATPDGARSPQGVLITAGVPPRRPPPAPGRAPVTPEPPSEADLVIPVNQGEPALRPRIRPEDAAPADEAEQDALATDAEVPAASDDATDVIVTRVAALAPRPRPAALTPEPADLTDTSADAPAVATPRARPASLNVADADVVPTEPVPEAGGTASGAAAASAAASVLGAIVPSAQVAAVVTSPYAVARSQLPKTRPRNFQRTVARASQQRQATAEPVRVAAASAIARPSGPTRGSVAQRATVANAINLGKVNLMGVYGTSSNRRALVRLPSGRFVKVKVGDRVDGGRVRAISSDQLSYVKSGRQIVLQMPRG